MITKKYHLGRFDSDNGLYCLGIQRSGNGTIPFPEETHNGVRNDITMRAVKSIDKMNGYITAILGEFAFEGLNSKEYFFEFTFKNWDKNSEKIFEKYLEDILPGKIRPLNSKELKELSNIVGLEFN
jgi:hypothetical protein